MSDSEIQLLDYAGELWSLANQVTGLAIVQGLGFVIALGKDLANLQKNPAFIKAWICVVSLVFTIIYCVVVFRCWMLAPLTKASLEETNIWRETTAWRCVAIVMFTAVLTAFGLFAPELFKSRENPSRQDVTRDP